MDKDDDDSIILRSDGPSELGFVPAIVFGANFATGTTKSEIPIASTAAGAFCIKDLIEAPLFLCATAKAWRGF
jgi:hypothetical protein